MIENTIATFEEWRPPGVLGEHTFDVGEVRYSVKGCLIVDLYEGGGRRAWVLVFETPLTVRISNEGSLLEYWRSGVVVRRHNLMRAATSSLLTWLERSSDGVHALGTMMHYAVFSEDVCIEVLARVAPTLKPVETRQ